MTATPNENQNKDQNENVDPPEVTVNNVDSQDDAELADDQTPMAYPADETEDEAEAEGTEDDRGTE